MTQPSLKELEARIRQRKHRECDIDGWRNADWIAALGDLADELSTLSEAMRAEVGGWRKQIGHAHTYTSENADLYRGFDNGLAYCAKHILRFIEGETQTQ